MNKIIFERGDENDDGLFDVVEPERITLDIPSGISIHDFKIICKRLASAIGYCQESIEDAFGSESEDCEEMLMQAHIREVLNKDAVDKFFDIPPSGSEKGSK